MNRQEIEMQLDLCLAEREMFIYWLLRAYQSGHREGWEPGPSSKETMEGLCNVLANVGYDPAEPEAKELLNRKPVFFVSEGK